LAAVRATLQQTIAGKERYLLNHASSTDVCRVVACQFLEVNLHELRAILRDIEACMRAQPVPVFQD
jgi:hypothetical protein